MMLTLFIVLLSISFYVFMGYRTWRFRTKYELAARKRVKIKNPVLVSYGRALESDRLGLSVSVTQAYCAVSFWPVYWLIVFPLIYFYHRGRVEIKEKNKPSLEDKLLGELRKEEAVENGALSLAKKTAKGGLSVC